MENTQSTVETKQKLPRAWDLFKQTISFYKENIRIVVSLFVIPFLFTAGGGIIFRPFVGNGKNLPIFDGAIIASFILGVLFYIAGAVFSLAVLIAFIRYLTEKGKGGPDISLDNHLKLGLKFFFPFIWVSILTSFVTVGGFLLFIIPGIIFSFYLMFSRYVLLDEEKRGLQALLQSWNYVKGYAWNIFLKSLFLGLMFLPLILLFAGIGFLVEILGGDINGESLAMIIVNLIGGFIQQIVIVPLGIIYTYMIYKNLKGIKSQVAQVEIEQKKRKNWLVGFSIAGLVVTFLTIIGIFASIVLVSWQTARMSTEERSEKINQLKNGFFSPTPSEFYQSTSTNQVSS